MARSKYTPEIVEIIIESIKKDGLDVNAYTTAGISYGAFYSWMRKYPEFKSKVEEARLFYCDEQPEKTKKLLRKSLIHYAINGYTEVWQKEIIREDPKTGEIILKEKTATTVTKAAPWAIERVMGKPLNEIEALKILVDNDWLPVRVINEIENEFNRFTENVKNIVKPHEPKAIEVKEENA